LSVKDVRLDHRKLRDWKNGVVETLTGGLGQLAGRRKIRHVRANAAFTGDNTLALDSVDAGQQRTSRRHIFAVGDVAGQPMLAHKASHEGRCAAEVIAGKRVAFQPSAIPAVVFTDPEIAYAGLSETDAKEKQVDVQVSRFPWAASGRSLTLGRSDGLTKLLVEPATERIIGVGIVGPGAGELIAEGVLAIEMGANAMDLGLTIHPHPTLTETLMEAAEVVHGTATHIYRPKKR
jgi:dihydrolipoamide dehydrogenase